MTRVNFLFCLIPMVMAAPAQAARLSDRPNFAAAPVPEVTLASVHSVAFDYPGDLVVLVTERARSDERTYNSVASVSMDNWWAYVGSELIAANLR